MEYKNKRDVAEHIVDTLLDNGVMDFTCGEMVEDKAKQECINLILNTVLSNFTIVQGKSID